jgi:methyl-accepting chemotaxis protein
MASSSRARKSPGSSGWFADRRVGTKIFTAIAAVVLAAIVGGVVATIALSDVYQRGSDLNERGLIPSTILADARVQATTARVAVRDMALNSDPAGVDDAERRMHTADAALDASIQAYLPLAADPAAVRRFTEIWGQYRAIRDSQLIPAARASELDTFVKISNEQTSPLSTKAAAELEAATTAQEADAAATVAAAGDTYRRSRTMLFMVLGIGILSAVALAWRVARMITGSLRRVSGVLAAVAGGDLTQQVGIDARDEVGQMAKALDTANARTRQAITAVAQTASNVAASSEELSATSEQIAATAEETSAQAGVVAAAAGQVSDNVHNVVAGAEQMAASIGEIARSASEAAAVAAQAVHEVESADGTITQLSTSSTEIGNVLNLITAIAQQTNLLALNATIEAARAGEAGKGFAVVASEVKDLAQETAKATEGIAARVAAIQNDTQAASRSITAITDVINKINQYQTTIAAAVEEQTATTDEISRHVTQAATGTNEIADNINGVARASQTAASGITESQAASRELAQMAGNLQNLVGQFRY